MGRTLSYAQAINEALHQTMAGEERLLCFGLGVDDPMRIFGTTTGLQERFGKQRVFDMPTAENGMTGVAIGAALNGTPVVMVHQRFDFFLLALDQLVNNAAKWHYMFGGRNSVPITIRLIVGQGWGQGPTHSQSLHAWLGHIPGLKVVMPTNPVDAKGMLTAALLDPNPVLFIEHRWLHATTAEVAEAPYRLPLERCRRLSTGDELTIVSTSYLTVEAQHACQFLAEQGIACDHLDLRSINPIDWPPIFESVRKSGRLLVVDSAHLTGSIAGEVVARVSEHCFDALSCAPARVALPDAPSPTSSALTRSYYPRAEQIVTAVGELLGRELDGSSLAAQRNTPHDLPGDWFKGPF
jgi:pyruvate/2-oxoglutarate/acetoin dehydrogenase E1 component